MSAVNQHTADNTPCGTAPRGWVTAYKEVGQVGVAVELPCAPYSALAGLPDTAYCVGGTGWAAVC
jgi:hypothetical protein